LLELVVNGIKVKVAKPEDPGYFRIASLILLIVLGTILLIAGLMRLWKWWSGKNSSPVVVTSDNNRNRTLGRFRANHSINNSLASLGPHRPDNKSREVLGRRDDVQFQRRCSSQTSLVHKKSAITSSQPNLPTEERVLRGEYVKIPMEDYEVPTKFHDNNDEAGSEFRIYNIHHSRGDLTRR